MKTVENFKQWCYEKNLELGEKIYHPSHAKDLKEYLEEE